MYQRGDVPCGIVVPLHTVSHVAHIKRPDISRNVTSVHSYSSALHREQYAVVRNSSTRIPSYPALCKILRMLLPSRGSLPCMCCCCAQSQTAMTASPGRPNVFSTLDTNFCSDLRALSHLFNLSLLASYVRCTSATASYASIRPCSTPSTRRSTLIEIFSPVYRTHSPHLAACSDPSFQFALDAVHLAVLHLLQAGALRVPQLSFAAFALASPCSRVTVRAASGRFGQYAGEAS